MRRFVVMVVGALVCVGVALAASQWIGLAGSGEAVRGSTRAMGLSSSRAPSAGFVGAGRLRGGVAVLPAGLGAVASAAIGARERRFWVVRRGGSLVASGGGLASVFDAAGVRLRVAEGWLRLSLGAWATVVVGCCR